MSVLGLFLVMKDDTLSIVFFLTTLEQKECALESSSSSDDDLLDSDDSKQKEMTNMKCTIAASWATYRRMRAEGKVGAIPLKLTPMRKEDQLIKYYDDNGLLFAPIASQQTMTMSNALTHGRIRLAIIKLTRWH
jgi:hypothetical protein